MAHRRSQLDMPHAFAAHPGTGNLHAATVADHAFVTNSFIFAAVALPIFGRPKNSLAKQAVPFRLQRAIIDSFRLLNLAI